MEDAYEFIAISAVRWCSVRHRVPINKKPALRRGEVYLVPGIEWYLGVIR